MSRIVSAVEKADAADLIQRGLACGVMKKESDGTLYCRVRVAKEEKKFLFAENYDEAAVELAKLYFEYRRVIAFAIGQAENSEQRQARYEAIGKLLNVHLPPYGEAKAKDFQRLAKMVDASQRRADLWLEADHIQKQIGCTAGKGNS